MGMLSEWGEVGKDSGARKEGKGRERKRGEV